ncbi:conserved Plasmodium protein, unknown function [Plasmodium malariae]|uniref:Uncharacterized protein n=1 Tax=Plasmodium malariae TaxID=5858 RepID=A0A1C3KYX7_PLAMA|nr:conserved Plasmodium protein, unknown function [Plasmodium malariae]SBT79415.1 conserved Plasmodium protein, unknown function [Plasmodium malariae]
MIYSSKIWKTVARKSRGIIQNEGLSRFMSFEKRNTKSTHVYVKRKIHNYNNYNNSSSHSNSTRNRNSISNSSRNSNNNNNCYYVRKNANGTNGGGNKSAFFQKKVLPFKKGLEKENYFKRTKIYYIEKNIFFIFGCFTSLYSVFVYDFFTNRYLQIFANFFFLIFHVSKHTVNMLACSIHILFILFQICVLFFKWNINLR